MSKFCIHGDYGQSCAQCHYEPHNGKCCCESCQLIRARDRIAELEQQRDELLAALEYLKLHRLWSNSHAKAIIESAIAKVKSK